MVLESLKLKGFSLVDNFGSLILEGFTWVHVLPLRVAKVHELP